VWLSVCVCVCACVADHAAGRAFRDACLTWTRIRPVATTQPSREGRVGEGDGGGGLRSLGVCESGVCVCVSPGTWTLLM
jgi:hypothetical protein